MSKIQLMGSGAFDVYCPTKRVYWRPDTSTTVIKVGQPVCYNSDIVKDHKERTADPSHLGLTQDTYEEGAQEFTGRLFIVEEPLTANLHAWAGIVKSLGPEAGADGDMIEIWVPTPGAVVTVYTDENCILDRTILGIRNGEASVSYPGRPIGVAIETKDRSGGTSDGMVWMKFKEFEYDVINAAGDAIANALVVDDEGTTASVLINSKSVRFDGSALYNRVLYYVGNLAGGGGALNGMFKFRTYVSSVLTTLAQTLCANLHIQDGGKLKSGSGEYNSAVYATVETEGATPDFSAVDLCAYQAVLYLTESGGACRNAHIIGVPNGTPTQWDGLIRAQSIAALGGHVSAGNAPAWAAGDIMIPVKIQNTNYYLIGYADDAAS